MVLIIRSETLINLNRHNEALAAIDEALDHAEYERILQARNRGQASDTESIGPL